MPKTSVAEPAITLQTIRNHVVGIEKKVPLLSGRPREYINFDNAASTPTFTEVLETVNKFMPWYSSVHRGAGFKSQLATKAYDDARQTVLKFFGANSAEHIVIFGKNTTEAINKLSYRLGLTKQDIVLVGMSEHHSNDLPWRARADVRHIKVNPSGDLDLNDLDDLLQQFKGRVKLVAVSAGSNVTGAVPDLKRIAKMTHAAGAQIIADCAQAAAHRKVDMGKLSDPGHLDYIAVSAHKMYAPFGTGALIGRKDTFESGPPELCGGGTIKVVTEDRVEWAAPPDRDEAGSPNVVGAIAFAKALKMLEAIGLDKIADHEADLTAYLLNKLKSIEGIKIYGDPNPSTAHSRLGVVSFNLKKTSHSLVAAILSTEWGIGVRNGCFCAHPYVINLLGMEERKIEQFRQEMLTDDRRNLPGMVRVSLGIYNTKAEIDILADALEQIVAGAYEGRYKQDKTSGDYLPLGWQASFDDYFKLA